MGRARVRRIRPETTVFLFFLAITLVVWILRGLTLLAFLPGLVIWLLILLTFTAGMVDVLQRMRR